MIMSRIGSSSGVRVAAAPLSNVYTVLLLVATLALILVLVAVWMTSNRNYGVILGVSDEGKKNMEAPQRALDDQVKRQKEMAAWEETFNKIPAGPTAEKIKTDLQNGVSSAPVAPVLTPAATPTDAPVAPVLTPTPTEAPAVAPIEAPTPTDAPAAGL
jgi:hypothetical protein